jgi:hypothetical protein
MRYETITFTVRFRVFDPGERIVVRDTGDEGVVERFHAPGYPEDDAFVFLEGRRGGIRAGECDPWLNPDLPVVRTMEQGDGSVLAWLKTPAGEEFMCDQTAGWTDFAAARKATIYADLDAAIADVTAYASSRGFASTQHHPL